MLIPLTADSTLDFGDHLFEYRGEGNSALVVRWADQTVVRLFKRRPEDRQTSDADRPQRHIAFIETAVARVLSPVWYAPPTLVLVSAQQMRAIDGCVRDRRPLFRLDKGIATDGDTLAILLPDYCQLPPQLRRAPTLGPVVCVEVKPKQGFLPKEALLSPQLKVKSRVSRFCLSQFLKLQKRAVERRSDYCPLDLFSGCPKRTQTAVRALLRTPQNNLRVFRDGIKIFGDETNAPPLLADFCPDLEALVRLITQALSLRVDVTRRDQSQLSVGQQCDLHARRCRCEQHSLTSGCVLEAVLRAQRLDAYDSELAFEMWRRINENNNACDVTSVQPLDDASDAFKVFWYLVALTAKDCSIMIAMQRVSRDDANASLLDGERRYVCSVRVTDLDQKSSEKIKRTALKDVRMVCAFNQFQS